MKRPSCCEISWAVHQKNGLTSYVHFSISYLLTRDTHDCLEKNRQRLHITAQVRSFQVAFVNPTQDCTIMTYHEPSLVKTISQIVSIFNTLVAHRARVPAHPNRTCQRDFETPMGVAIWPNVVLCALSRIRRRGVPAVSPSNPYFETGKHLHPCPPILLSTTLVLFDSIILCR